MTYSIKMQRASEEPRIEKNVSSSVFHTVLHIMEFIQFPEYQKRVTDKHVIETKLFSVDDVTIEFISTSK